jgi:hypothetical protein
MIRSISRVDERCGNPITLQPKFFAMKRIPILSLVLIPLLPWLLWGCSQRATTQYAMAQETTSLSFPTLKLEPDEFIQSIDLEIRGGRVASINQLLDDWDLELAWDNPGLLVLRMNARHFSAGLADLRLLNKFITLENQPGEALRLSAKLVSSSTDPTGRADRTYEIPHPQLMLTRGFRAGG